MNLTVYEGATGSGTGGSIIFGPANGDLAGTIITASASDLCLIFVFTSTPGFFGCAEGFETAMDVCSESLAGTTVTFAAPADLCIDDGVQTGLSGGSPSGGVYSGAGVTDDGNGMTYSFDPGTAGVGTQTLTYTNGGSASDDVEVVAIPMVNFTAPADLCIDAGTVSLSGATPSGGVYSGPGVTALGPNYSFNPAFAGVGIHTITYTEPGVCGATATDTIEVLAACGCTDPGETSEFYCGGTTAEIDLVVFEVCPSAGMAAQATINTGTYTLGGNTLTVYEGATGSATSGTLVFGPATGDLTGTVITGLASNQCLIFVSNSPTALGCQDGLETALSVCGEDVAPSISFAVTSDLCISDGIQTGLSGGLPVGGVYSGTGVTDDGNGMTYSFDPATAGVGVFTLTYDQGGNSASDTIEVFAIGTTGCLDFTAPADLCVDAGVQTGLGSGSPTGGVYSGSGITDDGNGMTYSFNPIAAGVGVHIITYTEGGNSVTDDIEVFALPSVVFTALADLCVDAGIQLSSLTGTPSGGTYSGPGVTNIGDGINYLFNPLIAGVGTHTLTYTYTDGNGCTNSASDDVEVLGPTVTFTALADLCIDAGVQAGLGGGTPTGGVYSGSGVTDDGNGMTYSFDPAAAGVGVHTITYSYTDGGGCTGTATDDVEVFGLPTVTLTALADLCINAGVQAGLGGGTPTGGVYSGSGVTDDGNGMTYSFDPAASGVGVHTITYSYTDGGGCTSTATDNVEVFGLPTVTFTALADLCIDAGVQAGLGGGTPTGGVYSGSGVTDNGNGMTYSFDPAVAGVGVHTITYSYTDGGGCTGATTDDVEVFGLPTVTFTALADLCINAGVQAGLGGGTPTGGVYSGSGVTDDGNGMTYSFDPAAAGVGVHTITYSYTDGGGCTSVGMDNVEVFGLPIITFTALADLCINAGVQAGLGGGTPTGGVYSGSGVTDDGNGMTYSFDPAAAGVGVHTITYSYTDGGGCTSVGMDNVEVFGLPIITFTALADLCINAGVQAGLGGGTPTGGVYSGSGVTDDGNGMTYSFDPAAAGVGVHTITYDFTDGAGCTSTATDNVEVFGLPDATVTDTAPTYTANATGVTYQWINCDTNMPIPMETNQSFTATASGNYAVIVIENGCSSTSACFLYQLLDVEEEEFDTTKLKLYPNPADDYIMLNKPVEKIIVFTISGQKILETTNNKLDTSEMKAGVYFVSIKTIKGNQVIKRFIKK
ncbi:T9SS type A sorting domain-containing protein [Aquimarina sp. 2201CG14-23]|uniref:T9SS type A sorting domain-containing protein n=1 Tax=Aquimarina mycalae TaxID=3040073 RepID=UPI0024780D58|nr:T9SS type A sorting domain-containing protein [Aquimarina sp. 2201CG14-23]MDH7444355.1 T9SS type A sorting domain-containing protein [Aquimarina sp. 2201CG14-23]